MSHKCHLQLWESAVIKWIQKHFALVFAVCSGGLLLFDVLCVYLCDRMDGANLLPEFLAWLLPVTAAFFAGGWVVLFLCRKIRWMRYVLAVPAVLLVALNLFVAGTMLWVGNGMTPEMDLDVVEYGDDWDVLHGSKREAVRYLLSRCRLFGTGKEYYAYPDSALTDPDTTREIRRGAIAERSLAEAVFGEYRVRTTNPVLCYTYGLWVHMLYTLLAAGWFGSCVLGSRKLGSLKKKLLFWGSGLVPLLFVGWILLGGYGIIPDQLARLFSMEPEFAAIMVMPQITIMWMVLDLERG